MSHISSISRKTMAIAMAAAVAAAGPVGAGRRRRRPQASSRATAIIAGIATIVVTRIVSFETRRPVS